MESQNVFKNKNYVLTFFGRLVSNIGTTLYSFALSFYILKISGNNTVLQGTYLAVCGIVYVLVSLFGGVISDRFNKVRIMYLTDYIKGSIIIAITTLLIVVNNDNIVIPLLFVVGICNNILGALFSPASNSLLPLIVSEDKLQQANSYNSIMQSFQGIIGVVLAGVLYAMIPIYTLFYIVGGCYVLSGLSEMFIRYKYVKTTDKITVKQTFVDIKDGLVYVCKSKGLLYFIVAILFINFFFTPIVNNFYPYFVSGELTNANTYLLSNLLTPEMWYVVFEIVFASGSIISSMIVSTKDYKKASKPAKIGLSVIVLLCLACAVSYLIFVDNNVTISGFLIASVIVFLLIGLTIPFINIPTNTAILKISDASMLGKVSATIEICSTGLIPLASLLAGVILATLGSSALLFICTGGFAIITVFFAFNKTVNQI